MNSKISLILAAIVILVSGSIFIVNRKAQNQDSPPMKTEDTMMNQGSLAQDFNLKDTNGNTIKLSDYKGEKVYVKFWASWCSICLAGLDEIDTLSAQENDFKVLTIVAPGFNGEQSQADFIQWFNGIDAKNLTALLDEGGTVTRAYGVRAYPTSAYIGSDGILIKSLPGHASSKSITETFKGIY